jgi:hypothetical protein
LRELDVCGAEGRLPVVVELVQEIGHFLFIRSVIYSPLLAIDPDAKLGAITHQ